MITAEISALITRKELAELLRVSIPTIDRMSRTGRGPARLQLSSRRIAYRLVDVNYWLAEKAERGLQ